MSNFTESISTDKLVIIQEIINNLTVQQKERLASIKINWVFDDDLGYPTLELFYKDM